MIISFVNPAFRSTLPHPFIFSLLMLLGQDWCILQRDTDRWAWSSGRMIIGSAYLKKPWLRPAPVIWLVSYEGICDCIEVCTVWSHHSIAVADAFLLIVPDFLSMLFVFVMRSDRPLLYTQDEDRCSVDKAVALRHTSTWMLSIMLASVSVCAMWDQTCVLNLYQQCCSVPWFQYVKCWCNNY